MKFRGSTSKLLLAALALPSLFVTRANAITTTWTGVAGNGLWGDAGNWSTGVPGSTDTAQFAGAGSAIDLGGIDRPVGTISTTGAGWQINNGTLSGITTIRATDSTQINANIAANVLLGVHGASLLINGQISGNAILQSNEGATLTGLSLHSGRTRAFGLRLIGMGAAPNSPFFSAIGTVGLTLDYGPVVVDKIGDNVNVQTVSGDLFIHNSGNSAANESIGTLTVRGTASTIRIDSAAGSAAPMQLTAPVLNRVDTATALIDVDPSNGGRLMLGAAPQQIGGIIPWAIGVRNGVPSFVTYDNALGVRPLDLNTEYISTISPGISTASVRLTTGQSLSANATINALAIFGTGAGVQLSNGAQLVLTSGGISVAAPATPGIVDTVSGQGQLVLANEGVLHVGAAADDTNTYRITAPITAPSLVKSGAATLMLAAANTIAGDVYVNQGTLVSAAVGALGTGAGTVHLGVNSALNFASVPQSYGTLSIEATYIVPDGSTLMSFRTAELRIDDGITTTFAHLAGTAGTVFARGGGMLRITGDSPIQNGVTIEAHDGEIRVDGTIRPVTPGPSQNTLNTIEAFDSAIVSGSGAIFGSVLGNIEPGSGVDDAGRFTINRLSSFNGGRIGIDLAGNVAGDDYDQLVVMLQAALTNRTLDVDLLNGFTPALGSQFTIIDDRFAGAIFGTFAGLPQDSLLFADGRAFQIDYLGGDGNDVVLTAVVPEPASALLGATVSALGLIQQRNRRTR